MIRETGLEAGKAIFGDRLRVKASSDDHPSFGITLRLAIIAFRAENARALPLRASVIGRNPAILFPGQSRDNLVGFFAFFLYNTPLFADIPGEPSDACPQGFFGPVAQFAEFLAFWNRDGILVV